MGRSARGKRDYSASPCNLSSERGAAGRIDALDESTNAALARDFELGIEIGQRQQRERALGEMRGRHAKGGLVDRDIAVDEDVEIDHTRAPALALARAAVRALDREQRLEELARGKLGR